MKHIAIIGRGILGLSAAYRFRKAGFKVSVLGLKSGAETASHAAVGVSAIKGQTLARSPLFKAKVLGHNHLPVWLSELEKDSGVEIPRSFVGVYEPFLNRKDFQRVYATAYRGRFSQVFPHKILPNAEGIFSHSVPGFFFTRVMVGFPHPQCSAL